MFIRTHHSTLVLIFLLGLSTVNQTESKGLIGSTFDLVFHKKTTTTESPITITTTPSAAETTPNDQLSNVAPPETNEKLEEKLEEIDPLSETTTATGTGESTTNSSKKAFMNAPNASCPSGRVLVNGRCRKAF